MAGSTATARRERFVVLGVGNTLCRDDGVGGAVVQALATCDWKGEVACIDAGTVSFPLLAEVDDREGLVVVDAARLGEKPGDVTVLEGPEMDAFLAHGKKSSAHEVSLSELLSAAALTGNLPARRALVAIAPLTVELGLSPSPPVQAAIPEACRRIEELIEAWQS